MSRRVHLPLFVREPTVAEGSRSLTRWAAIRKDLASDRTLVEELHRDPVSFFKRYGIDTSASEAARLAQTLGI